ncbi:MAG: peptidylprolyl isomerase [Bacteroidetes bacterium]|nr:peptidylprolyl isomerase [Bacteroidota bacterium]
MNTIRILTGLSLFVSTLFSIAQNNDPVLMTVGDSKITVSEFSSIYHKNSAKDEKASSQEAIEKYLDLFVNFKLKVKEAEDLKMDTVVAFKEELKGYRKQLAQPYLTDKDVNDKVLKEAYERLQSDVRASHILLKVADNALPKDTLAVYTKIMKLRERIIKGEDFNKVAKEVSEDPSAKDNGGDLGYFTAMQMVYPFESAAYNTKVGEVSMPVKTRFGYHLIKVVDKRKAQGEMLAAHIMVKTGDKMTKEDSLKAKTKIDELYAKIKAGEDFAQLAQTYSDDKPSAQKGGELPWFGTNRMPLEFEQAAFALKNNNDVAAPMQTKYGWHIIKRLDKKDLGTFESMKNELKGKVSKDSRSQIGRTSLIAKIKKDYGFKDNVKLKEEFYKVVDTSFFDGKWTADKAAKLNKPMFSFMDKQFTQTDFAKFLESRQTKRAKMDIKLLVDQSYAQFVDESAIAFEDGRLEQKYPEFKSLMQEYREGILLFELTDKKVWSKAVKDTTGLKEFYEKNKVNYMWDERADASIYTCADEKVAKAVRKLLSKNKSQADITAEINKTSQLNLQVENKIYTKGENKMIDENWTPGISADKKIDGNKISFVVVNKLLKPEPKAFNEAKGIITADYQNYLEKEWIASLKQKYKVDINKAVLSTVK